MLDAEVVKNSINASFDFTFALSDIIIKSSSLIQLKNEIVLTFVV